MDEKSMYTFLSDLGCCQLCCLRFLGERNPTAYLNVTDTLVKRELISESDGDNPRKVHKSNVCVACVGLLQKTQRDSITAKIVADVNDAGYDCKEFTCSLSMPVSYSLRDHSLSLHITEHFQILVDNDAPESHFLSVKDVWKWVVPPSIAQGISKMYNPSNDCDFSIIVCVQHEDDEKECSCLLEMHSDTYEIRKKQKRKFKADELFTRKSVEALLQSTPADHFKKFYPTPPNIPNVAVYWSRFILQHNPIYVAGRYNKYSRTLSQTPWLIDGERHCETSVQELLCDPIVKAAKANDMRFSSSGREDVDVRMLGRGRPFLCELINPHKIYLTSEDFRNIEKEVSSSTKDVSVRHLQIVSKEQVSIIKQGEEDKTKVYSAYCVVLGGNASVDWDKLRALSAKCPVTLQQKTPIRVLHRRSLATRERSLLWMEVNPAETEEPKAFVLRMATQAGTYVKEFVHGDFGRTSPSLRDLLGVDVDILALDVEDIEIDWPPEVKYEEENDVHP